MNPEDCTLGDRGTNTTVLTPIQQNSEKKVLNNDLFDEPTYSICLNDGRSTTDGVKYTYVNNMYLKLRELFWTEEEILLTDDPQGLDKLPVEHRAVLNGALMLATRLDEFIIEKLSTDVSDKFKPWEFRHWFALQKSSETVHSRTYAKAFEYYYPKKVSKLTDVFMKMKTLSEFENWTKKYMRSDMPVLERMVALMCIEGIVFVTPFSIILNFGIAGKMVGLSDMIKLITPDENLHASVDCHIVSILIQEYVDRNFVVPENNQKHPTNITRDMRKEMAIVRVQRVISEIVDICCRWIDEVQYFGLEDFSLTEKVSKQRNMWTVYNMTSNDLKSQVKAAANLYYGKIFTEKTMYPRKEAKFIQRLVEHFVLSGKFLFPRRMQRATLM